ncbi:helix-turn-helix domain-containing protein [Microbacterium sp. Yaish 1]|uniref:helix-turn-helix domain-containing protein n=1 Tax=Microbacterium sp. Yaish 1 TaxID=2025014 RepID=UPI000B944143|nr:helix-turn-helix domain-containing protein [Microbacterium sp. Yaish 1]OYC97238.1 hypothetical protein CI089_01410 [Microbacterium sp. Yaish 1]
MAAGTQGEATGLALDVARYVQRQAAHRGLSYDDVARAIGMSKTYTQKRLLGQLAFTLRDFEMLAGLFGLDPDELLARVQLPEAADYDGRLVPRYEVVSRKGEKVVRRVSDADPGMAGDNVIEGRFGRNVGDTTKDLAEVASPIAHNNDETDDNFDA